MDYTKNLNLKKPSSDDFYNINDQNKNMDKIDASIESYHGKVIFTADPLEKQEEPGKWKRATIYVYNLDISYVTSVGSIGYVKLTDYIHEEIMDFLVVGVTTFENKSDLYIRDTMTNMRGSGYNNVNFGSRTTDEGKFTTHYSIVLEILYKVANEE